MYTMTLSNGMVRAEPNSYIAHANEKRDNKYYWVSNTTVSGNSAPHNNMPPYLAVYMWVRTA